MTVPNCHFTVCSGECSWRLGECACTMTLVTLRSTWMQSFPVRTVIWQLNARFTDPIRWGLYSQILFAPQSDFWLLRTATLEWCCICYMLHTYTVYRSLFVTHIYRVHTHKQHKSHSFRLQSYIITMDTAEYVKSLSVCIRYIPCLQRHCVCLLSSTIFERKIFRQRLMIHEIRDCNWAIAVIAID